MSFLSLPVSSNGSRGDLTLTRYLQEIRKFPMLEANEEYMLAKSWSEHQDKSAAHKLVTSHLRLAAKIATRYQGYGLPQAEVISEANIGLMQAVKRFDPDKGFRLSTYAMWWIRASIQEFILRSWSLVKIGSNAAQKKLFFNLRKAKAQIGAFEDGNLHPDNIKKIASQLNVPEKDVVAMNQRLSGSDSSLNTMVTKNSDASAEWQDWLIDESADHASDLENTQEQSYQSKLLYDALETLNEREKDIIIERRINEPQATLDNLSQKYGVSRERIRQIETRAFEKLKKAMIKAK